MDRPTRVYELDVTYPRGARTPGWAPPGWAPTYPGQSFEWPTPQRSLSLITARRRAAALEAFGAYVTVHPSNPVTWPAGPTEAAEADNLADQISVLQLVIDSQREEIERWKALYIGERARNNQAERWA